MIAALFVHHITLLHAAIIWGLAFHAGFQVGKGPKK